jgi:hypothetical protein
MGSGLENVSFKFPELALNSCCLISSGGSFLNAACPVPNGASSLGKSLDFSLSEHIITINTRVSEQSKIAGKLFHCWSQARIKAARCSAAEPLTVPFHRI